MSDSSAPTKQRPGWIRVRRLDLASEEQVSTTLGGLATVCQSANCPNIGDCWGRSTATFMVMGDKCTRACRFCNVDFGKPEPLNPHEPAQLAQSVRELGLKFAVVTCVDRDDLTDSGSAHWAACIDAVHEVGPDVQIEVLTGDFKGSEADIARVVRARPEVFAHNLETIPRLQGRVRHKARWDTSLRVLRLARSIAAAEGLPLVTKSGIMLGLGETYFEVQEAMHLLLEAGVEILTIGQYLKPMDRPDKLSVERFVEPAEFERLYDYGMQIGFAGIASGPLVRSSYRAETLYAQAMARKAAG
ncbi:MAG: lipoyl synthase [bacterium]